MLDGRGLIRMVALPAKKLLKPIHCITQGFLTSFTTYAFRVPMGTALNLQRDLSPSSLRRTLQCKSRDCIPASPVSRTANMSTGRSGQALNGLPFLS
jgi:hypothetical protein